MIRSTSHWLLHSTTAFVLGVTLWPALTIAALLTR